MTQPNLTVEELENVISSIDKANAVAAPAVAPARSILEVQSFVDPEELKKDVEFQFNDLDNAIREHAGKFVHYATKAAAARRQFEKMKVTVDVLESQLYAQHREALSGEGKKVTEAMVEGAVKTDPRYFKAQQKLIDARAQYDLANDAREAFSQRKDMLIQVSVDRRTEQQGQLRIMAARGEATDARETALQAVAAARSA